MSRIKIILLSMLAVLAVGAVASASASAAPVWEECKEKAGEGKEPPAKYDTIACNTQVKELKLRKFEWVEVTVAKPVTSSGGTFTLIAAGKEVVCTGVTDEGTIGPGGADKATKITFTGCRAGSASQKCKVRSAGGTYGTIELTNIPTKLEERSGKVVDNFEQKEVSPGKFEFVTLQFEPETGGSCTGYTETKVKGTEAAEVINLASGKVELNFPSTALEGDTLEAFGVESTEVGKDTQSLTSGAASRAS